MSDTILGFAPISVEAYAKLHVKSNPDERLPKVIKALRECVARAKAGARCDCGAPIWVIGSTWVGHACFTCITGEGYPDHDYEIDEVRRMRQAAEEEAPSAW